MDHAKDDAVANRRLQQFFASAHRSADHQVADPQCRGGRDGGVDGVLDRADAIAFGDRQLDHVLARRQARPTRKLQRRRHAAHHRLQPRIRQMAVDEKTFGVANHVTERDDPRHGVVRADVSVNQELYLVGLRPLQRIGRDAQRETRYGKRCLQSGHHLTGRVGRAGSGNCIQSVLLWGASAPQRSSALLANDLSRLSRL